MSLAELIPQQLQANIDKIIEDVEPNPWLTDAEKEEVKSFK